MIDDGRSLRALVLTNHLKWFGGSEIVALEIASGLASLGDDVTLASNVISAPLADHAEGLRLTDDIAGIELQTYDLVWCQHDLLSLLPLSTLARAAREGLPHIVQVSLSSFEPYEHLNGLLARALSADLYANSAETADAVAAANRGILKRDDIQLLHNAAPSAFWRRASPTQRLAQLGSVLFVSNHPPTEIDVCAELLIARGVCVRRVGTGHAVRLIEPNDLASTDAVVSIGKTISYAIAMGKPAFVYDHFGGDGWLTTDNFELNRYFNFSGRPHLRRLDPEALAAEIFEGYDEAAMQSVKFAAQFDLSQFHLDNHIHALRDDTVRRASASQRLQRRMKLSLLLTQPLFRAHLETSRRKAEVMRNLRRHMDR
ncbi:MAG: hypothetical protein K2X34_12115 [Hyphomonadaceae bacterium]|nr:hypothetical protein [Hyphomonadaceae bacterium]